MKKQIGKKIIIIIVGLIFISTQFIYPLTLNAEVKLNWDNPNQGKNPYKFKLSDYLNSQMAMQIVGCTGIVDKIAGTMSKLMSGNPEDIKWIWASQKEKILEQVCMGVSLGIISGASAIPLVNIEQAPKTIGEYCQTQKSVDKEVSRELKKQIDLTNSSKFREECLNGIAYNLARTQLTAMTKQTMNWVTSGFNGDPMYVRNMNSFMNSIEEEIIYQELNSIKNLDGTYNTRDYPYGRDFSASFIRSRQSAENFADSSKQDLTNYLTDGATIEEFADDFSKGGWYGWLGLTQHAQNNPLGYTMNASQNIADKQAQEKENTINELNRNDGILDQKKCVEYKITAKYNESTGDMEKVTTDTCLVWETVTPGSLIQDKVSNYLGSPERQLEMADSINEVLNILFAKLIDKLRLDGLSSLNSQSFTNVSGGFGSNDWTTPIYYKDIDGNDTSGNKYAGSGLDENRAFDLTKDLGNIYNHSDVTYLGKWDASKNETTLVDGTKGLPLVPVKGQANTYYEVSVGGDTKLFEDDVVGWSIGDRAFFDGSYWQNWKKGMTSPVAKKGIIQIQQDYVVVAKELLKVMPGVMPALGELDYCIPGPNPNWQANSGEAYEAFSEYVSSLEAVYIIMETHENRADIVSPLEKTKSDAYVNYRNIFSNSYLPGWTQGWDSWAQVINTDIISYIEKLAQASGHKWLDVEDKQNGVSEANEEVSEMKQSIFDSLQIFNSEYPKVMNKIYGPIQNEYIERENSIIKEKNPAYIPMSTDGLNLTKKIQIYDEEISEADKDLKEAINEANSVINKLELIKKEVGVIIKTAQDRRDKTITEALNADPYNENYGTNYTAYKTKYAVCLDEENIDYLNYKDIVISEVNRCGDKIDNDFDGLIDEKDTDCGANSQTSTRRGTSGGERSTGTTSESGSFYYDNNEFGSKDYSTEATAY